MIILCWNVKKASYIVAAIMAKLAMAPHLYHDDGQTPRHAMLPGKVQVHIQSTSGDFLYIIFLFSNVLMIRTNIIIVFGLAIQDSSWSRLLGQNQSMILKLLILMARFQKKNFSRYNYKLLAQIWAAQYS